MDVLLDYGPQALALLKNPKYSIYIAGALLLIDMVLNALIIRTTPYTEIDWKTYMQQVQLYIDGERDYSLIKGDTGPLVYPAGHVYIYRILHYLTFGGEAIVLAQVWFMFLYIFNLGIVMQIYRLAKVPPYVFPMLILSKRLHSIYVLRCFNDCWATGALFLTILFFQNKQWSYGSVAFSIGVSIKMSNLLALPAILAILYQVHGLKGAALNFSYMLQVQLAISVEFMRRNAFAYLGRAFEFTRTFMYQWSVNWRFVTEDTFMSRNFSLGLLAAHLALLALFIFTRWLRPLGRSNTELVRLVAKNPNPEQQKLVMDALTAEFIPTAIFSSVAIGMLCARSLHYQFYSWIAWATPFLLWRAKLHPALQYIVWFGQEMAWNAYPPNETTSKVIVGTLALMVVQIWVGSDEPVPEYVDPFAKEENEKKTQ